VVIKPLHPKLAHGFGYRLSLSASMHSQTWLVIVTVTKWALLSSNSLPYCTFELNLYKVIIIFVVIKPLHPKLAHGFGYRLSLSASMHSQTWLVIVTVTKWALLSSNSLPVPRSTADENFNHNHLIVEEQFYCAAYLLWWQLQFINLSPSISPLFCVQNAEFLFTNYMHTCLLIILFLWHLVTQG